VTGLLGKSAKHNGEHEIERKMTGIKTHHQKTTNYNNNDEN